MQQLPLPVHDTDCTMGCIACHNPRSGAASSASPGLQHPASTFGAASPVLTCHLRASTGVLPQLPAARVPWLHPGALILTRGCVPQRAGREQAGPGACHRVWGPTHSRAAGHGGRVCGWQQRVRGLCPGRRLPHGGVLCDLVFGFRWSGDHGLWCPLGMGACAQGDDCTVEVCTI